MADDLSRTFLGSGPSGYGVSTVMGAILTEWDPATYANVVTDGAYTFQDCLVMHPSLLVVGRVLLYMTPAGPVILGNTYQKPPVVTPVTDGPPSPGGGNPGGGTAAITAAVDSGRVDTDTIAA